MTKRKTKQRNKEEIAENWCFVCKDGGGTCRVCDHKDCLKVYHPQCVEKDDSFLEAKDRWICDRHLCFLCPKASKFQCFCCTKSVCGLCLGAAEFVLIKGNKGFCNHCLKLAKLIEENKDIDSDGEKVNFTDQNTVEFYFMDYWVMLRDIEKLSLETIQSAYANLKKGRNFIVESELNEIHASEEEDERLVSDYDDSGDRREKRKRFKRQPHVIKRNVKSRSIEFEGWGTKALMEFLKSIGKVTTEPLTQDDVTSMIMEYAKEHKLFQPAKKKNVLCDARLYSLFRRKSVHKNRISDLLEAHFTENLVKSEEGDDDQDIEGINSDSKDENLSVDFKRDRNPTPKRKSQKEVVPLDAQQACYASIVEQNMKLVYLRRSLVEKLLKKPESFESKVVGSFVRVKSDPHDYLQKTSHQLLQVTGIKENLSSGKIKMDILLQISNRPKDIPISMLSDDYFSKEECEDLRRKVKDGLHKNPTIVEFEQKVKTLHKDITNHWIARELAILQNSIDQANEKGWRRDFYEYAERRELLQSSSEQSRLLNEVPEVIGLPAETEPISEDCIGDRKQRRRGSLEMNLKGTSEIPSKSLEGNGTRCILQHRMDAAGSFNVSHSLLLPETFACSPTSTPTESTAPDPPRHEMKTYSRRARPTKTSPPMSSTDAECTTPDSPSHELKIYSRRARPPKTSPPIFSTDSGDGDVFSLGSNVDNNAEAINVNIPEKTREGLDAEGKQHLTEETIPEELPQQSFILDPGVEHNGILQKSLIQVIELSDDEEEKSLVVTKTHPSEDPEPRIWHFNGPNGKMRGPFSLSLLKQWCNSSTYALKFKVWKTGQSENEAISMSNAISLLSPET